MAEDMESRIASDFAFLAGDEKILAVLLFGSQTKDATDERSNWNLCIVAPHIRTKGDMGAILRKIYANVDVTVKNYDVKLFEKLPLYLKVHVIENHTVLLCEDLPVLYDYFHLYQKLRADQKHRHELDAEEELKAILD